jgi:UDP-N-acetylmuramyl pentapeptide phosphotransferase/UDP-N-acetylglucosamine-1-phosphate transferase
MPAMIVIAIVASLALSLGLSLFARHSVRKMQFRQPDRELINFKLQMQYAGRAFIGAQILLAIAVAGLLSLGHVKDQDTLFAIFIFMLFLCIGMRQMFREVRIAAETELEYRKLHPQNGERETKQV